MADENDTGFASEVAAKDTPVQASETKKKRAPRRQKTAVAPAVAASEVTTSATAEPAKPVRRGPGRKTKAVEAASDSSAKSAVKGTRTKRVAKPVAKTEKAPVTARDEMTDLLQLEEENKRLRKTLAEKLRTENADLRKRLGLA